MQSRTMHTGGHRYDYQDSAGDPLANQYEMFVYPPIGSYERLWYDGSYLYPDVFDQSGIVEGMSSPLTYTWVIIVLIVLLFIILFIGK